MKSRETTDTQKLSKLLTYTQELSELLKQDKPLPVAEIEARIELIGGKNATLAYAVCYDFANVVEYLIESKADLEKKYDGQTALQWAASSNQTKILSRLVKAGSDVNAKNDKGRPPLFVATGHNNIEAMKMLIEAKADCNIKDDTSNWPVLSAPILTEDAPENFSAAISLLINGRADVNLKGGTEGETGGTALSLAIRHEHYKLADALIKTENIDINTQNDHGITPLMIAANMRNMDLVSTLIEAKADLSIKSHKGVVASDYTVPGGRIHALLTDLEAKASQDGLFGQNRREIEQPPLLPDDQTKNTKNRKF